MTVRVLQGDALERLRELPSGACGGGEDVSEHWMPVRDGDARLRGIYNRHYSRRRYSDNRIVRKTVGPGEYIALMTQDNRAAFIWRRFRDGSGQQGVSCAFFRNEGYPGAYSSELIMEAVGLAWARWPGERLYTYVSPHGSPGRTLRGRCFERAGWQHCGKTKGGLWILELWPPGAGMALAEPVAAQGGEEG